MPINTLRALYWNHDHLMLLDQRYLPGKESWLRLDNAADIATAIQNMAVRGAPAIGIAAAYGAALAAQQRLHEQPDNNQQNWQQVWQADLDTLAAARPTAVNLAWALERMQHAAQADATAQALLEEAQAIHTEDQRMNEQLSEHGAELIKPDSTVFTHCNTGALATGGQGTALGVIKTAFAQGKIRHVFVTETRPWLQGARLTAWELAREGIPTALLVDNAAASIMAREKPAWLIVGADRIAANGDVANKIGTYALALLAKHHGARVMVAAPSSTLDNSLANGHQIPIENRDPNDIWQAEWGEIPSRMQIENPGFDITPAKLIDAIVTEQGIRTG